MNKRKCIALLATGDEIIHGDILNTNTQFIAQALFDHDIQPGIQQTVPDDQPIMQAAMKQLLDSHDGLITIGGLGPTSDDLTRFALAEVLGVELTFDDASWAHIQSRFSHYQIPLSDNNRQQCLFPDRSTVLHNANGTANGCAIEHNGKMIFMLPGPPRECRPILDSAVIPTLLKQHFNTPYFKVNWLCLGIGEAQIASQLDPLMQNSHVQVGYRADTPYLEVKLFSENKAALVAMQAQFKKVLKPYIVSKQRQTTQAQLYQWLRQTKQKVTIIDNATKGYLASQLLSPETFSTVIFPEHPMRNADVTFIIEGLHKYWRQQSCNLFEIELLCLKPGEMARAMTFKIPNRGQLTCHYAVQFICWHMMKLIGDS